MAFSRPFGTCSVCPGFLALKRRDIGKGPTGLNLNRQRAE
jgi:hypothetical protein